ncbi:sulfotransferase [Cavenderia fasciculata]|uniref:Sulfotransferase n=1 Tax=Cavenderia fasciculata TaxID=261658 RepID=F4PRF5_CACFS|nr:sulfotransferase [Cavenderia fasciculata]EGG20507.1 sulfotransferase [Cavenderia fasciculata]|eukprot:XP_004358357.1 sulfotransferase [Cavenderia fasciculata]
MENKKLLYIALFIFVSIVGFQIYVTSKQPQVCNNNGGGTGAIDQQQFIIETLQQTIRDQERALNDISKKTNLIYDTVQEATGAKNGIRGPTQTDAPYFTNPTDRHIQKLQIEARINKTKTTLPNTCFPLDQKTVCLPNFIVIGAMKAGTTFLDFYLQRHPMVAKHTKKELWFFNSYYNKGIEWYVQYFEPVVSLENPKLIGEATPFYINNPFTAARMFSTLRNAKFIMMMRDPVDRALSQYYFSLKWIDNNKGLAPHISYPESFDTMIREEIDVINTCVRGNQEYIKKQDEKKRRELAGEPIDEAAEEEFKNPFFTLHTNKNWTFYKECARCDKCFQHGNILHTSGHPSFGMIAKSLYYEQIDYWLDFFPLEQFLFVRYEDLNDRPEHVLRQVEEFLGLPAFDYGQFKAKNAVPHEPMDPELRQLLVDYFKPHNEKLYRLLNRDFGWSK